MRTSLTRLNTIEQFLHGNMSQAEQNIFEARLLMDSNLANDVKHQQRTYQIVRLYSRQMLKSELEVLHNDLVENPKHKSFWTRIHRIFQTK